MKSMNQVYNETWLKRHGSQFGRVYEIVNLATGDSYIGTTKGPIKKRLYQAIAAANAATAGVLYDSIREWGKESFDIRILHECTEYEDLLSEGRKYILKINPLLNKK